MTSIALIQGRNREIDTEWRLAIRQKQKNGCALQQNIVFWVNLKIPHQINKIPQFSELGAGFPALFRICRYSPDFTKFG